MTFHRTRWVTFPRSGHSWAVRMLQHALPGIVYDEHHGTGRTLENSPEIHLQKTHDFALDVPISEEFRHIVQVRDFVKSMESWKLQRDGLHLPKLGATEMLAFYHAFILKWIVGEVPNRLIVHYGDLIGRPFATVAGIIHHVVVPQFSTSGQAVYAAGLAAEAIVFEPPKKTE